jgi:hypothetical protein
MPTPDDPNQLTRRDRIALELLKHFISARSDTIENDIEDALRIADKFIAAGGQQR